MQKLVASDITFGPFPCRESKAMSKPMLSASLKQRFKASDLKSLRLQFPALNPQRFENAVICDCEFASLRTPLFWVMTPFFRVMEDDSWAVKQSGTAFASLLPRLL